MSKRKRALLVATIAGAAAVLPHPARAHPSAEARLAALERRLGDDRDSAAYHLERAEAQREARHWSEALADVARARALDPSLQRALLVEAEIHCERGAPAEAIPLLETALANRPDDAGARHLHARALRDAGRLAESAAEYDLLLARSSAPRPETFVERARVVAAAGRIDEATHGLDEGLARLGMLAALQLTAVELEVERGGFDAAVRRLDRLLAQAPGQAFWLTRRAEVLALAGRHEEARAGFELAQRSLTNRPSVALRDLEGRIRTGLAREGE